jgi:MarR-like DNA-binding transcriptional regulator SgrR of sgrS sRNA
MSYGLPIDPSNVKTLVDLDLSYALASTLVDWSASRTLKDGLAIPVENANDKEITFKLRPEAKWSDGGTITAEQVVRSFARAKKLYGQDLKSLFEMIDAIDAKDAGSVVFRLNRPVGTSQIHHKLTEPMYGIVFVRPDGVADFGKSSGPFCLTSQSPTELTLAANPHWYGKAAGMADKVVIRQPNGPSVGVQDTFASDSWPNIITSTSLIPKELEHRYEKEQFATWNRNLDRIFFFAPGTRLANPEGRQLFQALNQRLDRQILLQGLSGYRVSQQFFPPGYVIYDSEFKIVNSDVEIPSRFKTKPLQFLGPKGRLGLALQNNISKVILELTGQKPQFHVVPLGEIEKARAEGQFDILVASVPVNDPNVEGAVSFFFGMTPPLIPNSDEPTGNFKKRTTEARSMNEFKRNLEYRQVFSEAVQDGCLLPLFHFSSVVIARDGIDLSGVPTSDETVAFSKVRFK